jgi:hypothetical protein
MGNCGGAILRADGISATWQTPLRVAYFGELVSDAAGTVWIGDEIGGLYRSEDGNSWTRQAGNLLEAPGKGADDQAQGQHADVLVSGDRAWLFYFTHPGRKPGAPDSYESRRSSIQVVELKESGGLLSADRDTPTSIALRDP